MKTQTIVDSLGLKVITAGEGLDREVTRGYASDLLSDVMGNVSEGAIWLTVQVHRNTVAVAALKEVAAIVLTGGAKMDDDVIADARSQGVTVLATDKPTFEMCGLIYGVLSL